MPQKYIEERSFGLPPREIERLLFSEGALRRFHDQFHGESSLASVSQWKEKQPAGGNQELSERMVIFSMPFNLPAALRTLLPNDKVVIHERQEIERNVNTGGFVIRSYPLARNRIGKSLSTHVVTEACPSPEGCCVRMTTTVDATGPWGVSALLEAVMAAEARQASSDFFRFAAAAVMMFLEGREAMLVAEPCHMKEVNDHDLSIGAAQSAQGSPVLRECNAAQMPATGGKEPEKEGMSQLLTIVQSIDDRLARLELSSTSSRSWLSLPTLLSAFAGAVFALIVERCL